MRRRSVTNGDGAQTPESAHPGMGGGPLAVGLGPGGPGGGFGGVPGGQDQDQSGPGGLPVPATSSRLPVSGGGGAPRGGSRLSLSNWRVRWRLIAIIAVPTVTALILGAIQISNSVGNYTSFKRVQTLANLNSLVVKAVGQLEDERDDTAGYVAAGRSSPSMLGIVTQDQARTNTTLSAIKAQADNVVGDGSYQAQTVLDLQNGVLSAIAEVFRHREAGKRRDPLQTRRRGRTGDHEDTAVRRAMSRN